jgi:hypothetical protein
MSSRSRPAPALRFFGSVKLMVLLILAFAIACAVATFIEAASGTPAARALVYDALWFEVLIGLLIVNLTLLLFQRAPYRRRQLGFFFVHLSAIVILLSSGITRFFGYEGMMHIREGKSSNSLMSRDDYLLLSTADEEAGFVVAPWKAGPSRIRGTMDLAGESYRLAITEYFTHYARRLSDDPEGLATLSFALSEAGQGMRRLSLSAGDELRVADVNFRFHAAGLPELESDSPHGELVARLGGEEARLSVGIGGSVELGGLTLRIEEFHADYSKRTELPEPTEMSNPMVRVSAVGPDGSESSRLLFAYFPDFSTNRSGDDDPFPELEIRYDYGRSFELAVSAGALVARANFALERFDMASGKPDSTFAAGVPFSPPLRAMLRSGEFSMVPTEFWEHASLQAVQSENPDAPAAARIEVTGPSGDRIEEILRRGEQRDISIGEQRLSLHFGSRRIELPYRIELDDFQLITYPGSSNPASYESHVRLYDEAAGIDGRPVRIFMNHPLTYKGHKHFQSSYDQDHLGTVLSVNRDPGKWPTYIGYILIGLGFLLILFKSALARSESRPTGKKESA